MGLRIKYQIKFQRAASDIDNQLAGSQFVNRNCSCPEMPLGRTATKTSISIILISIISISIILILIDKMLTFVGQQSANDEILARVVSKLFSYFSSSGRVFKLSDHAMYTDRVLSSQQSHDALKHTFGSRQFSKGGGGGGGGVGGGVRLYNKYGTSNM